MLLFPKMMFIHNVSPYKDIPGKNRFISINGKFLFKADRFNKNIKFVQDLTGLNSNRFSINCLFANLETANKKKRNKFLMEV